MRNSLPIQLFLEYGHNCFVGKQIYIIYEETLQFKHIEISIPAGPREYK